MYFDYSTEDNAQRALNWFEIDQLFSEHCYYQRTNKFRDELEACWANRKDIAYAEGRNCYNGRKSVYAVYAEFEEKMQQEQLKLLQNKNPDRFLLSEGSSGSESMKIQYSGSAFIEVAKDGDTAKGVWYLVKLTIEPDDNGVPRSILHTGRAAVDFVKENNVWKIWHYRTSPDFSYKIPSESFLKGVENWAPLHPNSNCPKPNVQLVPCEAHYSPINISHNDLMVPEDYQSWSLETSFVRPQNDGSWIWNEDLQFNLPDADPDLDARYAANYIEVLNVASIHCYGYASQQMVQELDRFWAQRTENVAGCHADRAHQGHSIQYKYYARGNMGMNWGKVQIMHNLYPDKVELHPYNLGIGELIIRYYTSPYIVVADDCKTAQGVWYSFGISSEIDKGAHPVPFMQWGREMADFVLEGDSWRMLHFRLSADIDYLLDGDILLGIGIEEGIPRTAVLERPKADTILQAFPMDEVYSPFRVANYSPEPPFPFETWDNRLSWVLPEGHE